MSPRTLIPDSRPAGDPCRPARLAAAAVEKAPGVGLDASSLPLSAPDGDVAYLARGGKRATRLLETGRDGGPALRTLRLAGQLRRCPPWPTTGSPAGLSADGRTLILVNPRTRFPRASTTLAVVDAKRMRLRRQIRLRGDFSFDAISPDGRLLYLIQYLSKRDITDYAVRAYDMRAGRLFRRAVVDPSEPDEDMSGVPLARVMGPGGRWAYTLYASEEHPFVHALDTERRTAVCIDLDIHGGDDAGPARRPARRPRGRAGARQHRHLDTPCDRARCEAPGTAEARDRGGGGLPLACDRRAHGRPDAAGGGGPAATRTAPYRSGV